MNIGVLGTGVVGETIATALTEKGHNVRLGSRSANNEKAAAWVKKSNHHATQGDFADAASFGEILFLCLNGAHALDAVQSIDRDSVNGKIVVDVTNPLDFSKGMPPRLIEGLVIQLRWVKKSRQRFQGPGLLKRLILLPAMSW